MATGSVVLIPKPVFDGVAVSEAKGPVKDAGELLLKPPAGVEDSGTAVVPAGDDVKEPSPETGTDGVYELVKGTDEGLGETRLREELKEFVEEGPGSMDVSVQGM